ncbi:MAG TPA: roadblock/LC7 domain-containing protein [Verrucomicrobiae bacterium]|jgi:predicted regulator of Ras-like GTPase activity (Roadblock/LC7/MglB family)
MSTKARRNTHDMATLPQLLEDDIRQLDEALRQLLKASNASTALVIDNGGFLLTHQGEAEQFDLTTIAALASGAYLANQTIANLVHEENFNSVYQQGEKFSMFGTRINDETLLLVIFEARVSVGAVKYYAASTVRRIAAQLVIAHERDPDGGLDLSMLNVADTSSFFKKK